jgi:hypothetical protein
VATAWRLSGDGTWETIGLGLPDGGTASFIGGVLQTPSGLAFVGEAQIRDSSLVAILWLEP